MWFKKPNNLGLANDMNFYLKLSLYAKITVGFQHILNCQKVHTCLKAKRYLVGWNYGSQKLCWRHSPCYLGMTLFGKKVFTDVIQLKWGYTALWWTQSKGGTLGHTQDNTIWWQRQTFATQGRQGIVGTYQKVEEARKCSSLEPSEGVWPCGHLAFRFLASRAVREDISVVVSYPFCGNLLEQPQEVNSHHNRFLKLKDSPLFCYDCVEKHPDGLLKSK